MSLQEFPFRISSLATLAAGLIVTMLIDSIALGYEHTYGPTLIIGLGVTVAIFLIAPISRVVRGWLWRQDQPNDGARKWNRWASVYLTAMLVLVVLVKVFGRRG